jgi:hypothetical protein
MGGQFSGAAGATEEAAPAAVATGPPAVATGPPVAPAAVATGPESKERLDGGRLRRKKGARKTKRRRKSIRTVRR